MDSRVEFEAWWMTSGYDYSIAFTCWQAALASRSAEVEALREALLEISGTTDGTDCNRKAYLAAKRQYHDRCTI